MTAVSRKAPREEGVEEAKTIPMTVRASATIYEKLRVEADARGVSVPALIIYQMGEWLRGDELDRKSPAGDPAVRRERRGEEAEEAELIDWECADPECREVNLLDDVVEAGYRCPKCGGTTGTIGPADAESGEEDGPLTTIKEGMREEPKVSGVLKCENDGGLLGDPCGWSGKKAEAAVSFNPLTRTRIYSCPKCKAELAKARLFDQKDDVLTCPECKTAYRRDELKEGTSWGKEWLICPGPDPSSFSGECGGKVIEAVHAEKAKGKASRKAPGSQE